MFGRPRREWPARVILGATILSIALLLGACGDDSTSNESSDSTSTEVTTIPSSRSPDPTREPALQDTPWTLDNSSLPAASDIDVVITATFSDGRLTGSSGCNNYASTYQVDGSDLTIAAEIVSTEMACEPDIMAAEAAYLAALPDTATYQLVDSRLELVDRSGAVVVSFHATDLVVVGSWEVVAYRTPNAVMSPIIGAEPRLTFADDGNLSGSSGCDDFTGRYTTDGSSISVTELAPTTANDCPADLAQQQTDLFTALQGASSFEITGAAVTLLQDDGTIAANLVSS